jgi:predicted ester cyclase
MSTKQDDTQPSKENPSAFDVVSAYVAALAAQDSGRMKSLHSPDFAFWTSWFAGFPEMDYEVTRTIAAEQVVVTQWVFTGAHTGPLEPPAFGSRLEPTGRIIQCRGVSIYDVSDGLIQRETIYMDLATLMVELGITS